MHRILLRSTRTNLRLDGMKKKKGCVMVFVLAREDGYSSWLVVVVVVVLRPGILPVTYSSQTASCRRWSRSMIKPGCFSDSVAISGLSPRADSNKPLTAFFQSSID